MACMPFSLLEVDRFQERLLLTVEQPKTTKLKSEETASIIPYPSSTSAIARYDEHAETWWTAVREGRWGLVAESHRG
jgi:hypothetical protein